MMSKQQKGKNVFCWVISAFLSVFFLEILLGIFIIAAPLNEKMMERGITESGLAETCVNTFKEQWSQALEERKMPADFAEELMDSRMLYSAFVSGVEQKGNGEAATESFQKALEEKMKEYLISKGIDENEAVQKASAQFIKEETASYQTYMYPVFIRKFYSVKNQTEKKNLLFLAAGILCSVCSCICLLRVSHYLHRGIRLISISLITAIAFYITMTLYLYHKINAWITALQPEFCKELLTKYETYFGQTVAIIVIAGIGIFLLLQIVGRQMKLHGK